MIPCQRHLFDIPAEVAYLNCAYLSPLPNAVREAGITGVRRKASPWELLPEHFFDESEAARGLFSALLGATADDVAIQPSVSYGLAIAGRNIALDAGDSILVLAEQFPSNVYPWRELARDREARIVSVPVPVEGSWTDAILGLLDERVRIAALPHCHWIDGGLIDLEAVGARCRDVGAALVVDATQSLVALPFDVTAVQPDFLVAATYKWLFGPYSLGFLYVAPRHQDGRPLEHNWIARAGAEDFARLIDYRDAFQPGARRFDVGERSNFALMPMACAALRQVHDWGVPEIAATLRALTDRIAARAEALGWSALPPGLRAPHYLGLSHAGGVLPGLAERLAAEHIYVSVSGAAMRVTPHLYNNDPDLDRLFAVLGAEA